MLKFQSLSQDLLVGLEAEELAERAVLLASFCADSGHSQGKRVIPEEPGLGGKRNLARSGAEQAWSWGPDSKHRFSKTSEMEVGWPKDKTTKLHNRLDQLLNSTNQLSIC